VSMVRREIDPDEEAFVEACEEAERDSLIAQKERSEREYREGRVVAWEHIKHRLGL
jgi:hypothetical protein